MSVHGLAAAGSTRGNATFFYRKLPEGGVLETGVDCSAVFASSAHPNARCGLVLYNAGAGMHLVTCGITRRNGGSTYIVELESANATAAVATTDVGSVAWGATAFFRIERDVTNRLYRCRARSSMAAGDTGWTNVNVTQALTASDVALASVDVGDLWHGLAAVSWGGSEATFAAAAFTYARSFVPVPAAAPTDVNGEIDRCIAAGTTVRPVSVVTAATARTARLTGLSQNFPYSVSVVELRSGGVTVPQAGYVPHAYARPMPPRPWALGAWYDARLIFASSALAPGTNRLGRWPDSSGRGHHLTASGDRRPVIIASQVRGQRAPRC